MGDYVMETEEYRGGRIEIRSDPDSSSMNPRDNDNLAVLVFAPHRRYTMPNECDFPFGDEDYDWSEDNPTGRKEGEGLGTWAQRVLTEHCEAIYIASVYSYEHGAIAYRVAEGNPFPDPGFDSGQCGWAIVTKQSQEMCGTPPEHFAEVVKAEVEEYSDWCNGYVYYWAAIAPNGEEIENCGGYIGMDCFKDMLGEGRYAIDWWHDDQDKKRENQAADAMAQLLPTIG